MNISLPPSTSLPWNKNRVITEVLNPRPARLYYAASQNSYKSLTPFIQSFRSLSYKPTAPSKTSSPQRAIHCFLLQFLVSSLFFNIIQ